MTETGYVTPEECTAYKAGRDAAPPDAATLAAAALALKFVGRCATCRWVTEGYFGCSELACARAETDAAWTAPAEAGRALAHGEAGGWLEVAPDFGCVTWEAKVTPPGETKPS